ncbi:MAG: hypothetical protein RLZ23_1296 [Actinomycetota bacterium]
MAATAFTWPTFSAINTNTTGRKSKIALVSNDGEVNVGSANHFAAFTPSKLISPCVAANA